ncbi:MAG: helix-turn-helix domain-containing protein [Candidatus Bathyarchaeota archaeon]|nr:helix-turn-helix domain-containing protein [Candidatus Bathyarchaeota archaeon]
MKLLKMVDSKSANLVTDPLNQAILRELVAAPHAATDLAAQLKQPTLTTWRRMQKLEKANLIEHTQTQKVGNLEKKYYRATAAYYAPEQFFNFKPKNANLKEAFDIYQGIQNRMVAQLSAYNEIPEGAEPTDFSLFVNMLVFAEVCGRPEIQAKIVELKAKLVQFDPEQVKTVL